MTSTRTQQVNTMLPLPEVRAAEQHDGDHAEEAEDRRRPGGAGVGPLVVVAVEPAGLLGERLHLVRIEPRSRCGWRLRP